MELTISNSKNKIDLADNVFACEFNEPLVHQVVTAYMTTGRAGTKAQKTRAEVRGGGAKPFKQKGTGRARAGTIRSPIWRKGGVVFAAKPRCFNQKVNRKMFRGALRSIFSELIRQNRLFVVDSLQIDTPRTKALLAYFDQIKISGNILLVSDEIDDNLFLSARNLPHVQVCDVSAAVADPVTLIKMEKVVIKQSAIKAIEELLK